MGLFDWLLHRLIDQIFNQVDYNNNGRLEAIEIEVAILKIYNIINRRLPGWQNPPTRAQIATALTVFDVDGNGTLDRSEFYLFTKDMVHSGPDTFFKRVGTSAVLRTALIPGVTHLLQKVARQSGQFGKFGNAPLAIMAPTMGVLGGALRGLIPMGQDTHIYMIKPGSIYSWWCDHWECCCGTCDGCLRKYWSESIWPYG